MCSTSALSLTPGVVPRCQPLSQAEVGAVSHGPSVARTGPYSGPARLHIHPSPAGRCLIGPCRVLLLFCVLLKQDPVFIRYTGWWTGCWRTAGRYAFVPMVQKLMYLPMVLQHTLVLGDGLFSKPPLPMVAMVLRINLCSLRDGGTLLPSTT